MCMRTPAAGEQCQDPRLLLPLRLEKGELSSPLGFWLFLSKRGKQFNFVEPEIPTISWLWDAGFQLTSSMVLLPLDQFFPIWKCLRDEILEEVDALKRFSGSMQI